jgi:L-ascorbate metabolism protein UlaG (beta-lactamase superfamily)
MLAPAPKPQGGKGLTVMFVGVATLLFDDGETAIMTDGYFSRPRRTSCAASARTARPSRRRSSRRASSRSAAVIPVHSHFDHALDSPVVAMQTGALLVGSSSTANIGRGQGVPGGPHPRRESGDSQAFGSLKCTFLPSAHLPTGYATGPITTPLRVPAPASDSGKATPIRC